MGVSFYKFAKRVVSAYNLLVPHWPPFMKHKTWAIVIIILAVLLGYFVYASENPDSRFYKPFHFGLDLAGGTHLVYEADTSELERSDINGAIISLREVIERRVNTFGVSEPLVQSSSSILSGEQKHRLIIELPGITDIDEALSLIDATPELEFRIENPNFDEADLQEAVVVDGVVEIVANLDNAFISSGLTGRYLEKATVQFGQGHQAATGPFISLNFNSEGADIFAEITRNNIGKIVAIYLDGQIISTPVVQGEITGGQAQITGEFTIDEANELARNLNLGALPVPISLVSTETIGPSLGLEVLEKGVQAGIYGLILVALFMVLWYRLPGVVAVLALTIYVLIILSIFKLMPVTLTAAGIAGFILSIGIAVDANILIFERFKEELRGEKQMDDSLRDGFKRAWTSIRDSNLSSIISATILFWFGTSLIKGFALVLALGIIVSMFTAITVTRTILLSVMPTHKKPRTLFLFGSGFSK